MLSVLIIDERKKFQMVLLFEFYLGNYHLLKIFQHYTLNTGLALDFAGMSDSLTLQHILKQESEFLSRKNEIKSKIIFSEIT